MITILFLSVFIVASGVTLVVCKGTRQADKDMRIIRRRERLRSE